jgi:hypothetical protein
VLLAQYFSGDEIEKNKIGGCEGRIGKKRGVYRILAGKPDVNSQLGRPRRRWEDNIKMYLQEVGCGVVDWIELAHAWDRWRALVNAVMDIQIP